MKHVVGDIWQTIDGWFVKTPLGVFPCKSRGEALQKLHTKKRSAVSRSIYSK